MGLNIGLEELLDHIKVGGSTLVHISCNMTDAYSVVSLVFHNDEVKEEEKEVNLNVPDFMKERGHYREVM